MKRRIRRGKQCSRRRGIADPRTVTTAPTAAATWWAAVVRAGRRLSAEQPVCDRGRRNIVQRRIGRSSRSTGTVNNTSRQWFRDQLHSGNDVERHAGHHRAEQQWRLAPAEEAPAIAYTAAGRPKCAVDSPSLHGRWAREFPAMGSAMCRMFPWPRTRTTMDMYCARRKSTRRERRSPGKAAAPIR